jgi:hypothetical protein
MIKLAIPTAMLFGLFVVWTAVKMEYREFISTTSGSAVQNDYSTRLTKLGELIFALDEQNLTSGLNSLIYRIGYVDLFGAVLVEVPAHTPHEFGAILRDALERPFMPRLFFPNKEIIDDTVRTMRYTGMQFSASESTSVSLGFVAETYIDFGEFWMFPILFSIGLFYGRIYKGLMSSPMLRGLLGMGVITSVFFNIASLEISFTKAFGGLLVAVIVSWLLGNYIVPRYWSWLRYSVPRGSALQPR